MNAKSGILLAACFLFLVAEAYAKSNDVTSKSQLIDLSKFKDHMDEFRSCIDKHLSNVVGGVQEDQLQPVLSVIEDQVGRLAKAWDVLTAAKSTQSPEDK